MCGLPTACAPYLILCLVNCAGSLVYRTRFLFESNLFYNCNRGTTLATCASQPNHSSLKLTGILAVCQIKQPDITVLCHYTSSWSLCTYYHIMQPIRLLCLGSPGSIPRCFDSNTAVVWFASIPPLSLSLSDHDTSVRDNVAFIKDCFYLNIDFWGIAINRICVVNHILLVYILTCHV